MQIQRLLRAFAIALLAFGFAACASNPPTRTLDSTEKTIAKAEEAGAAEGTESNLHLQLALDQQKKAEKLLKSGHEELARRAAMKAHADAELALALAREAAIRAKVEQQAEAVEKLRQDITTSSK